MSRLVPLTLAGLAILLAGLIGVELTAKSKVPVVLPAAVPAATTAAAASDGPSADQVALLLARPPFNADRRPTAEEAAAPTATPGVALPRLTGVMLFQGTKQAIFAGDGTGKAILVGEGDSIAGFRVQSIKAGEVTLQDGTSTRAVQPRYANSSASPGGEAPAAMPFSSNPTPSGFDILKFAPPVPIVPSGRPALGAAR